MLAGRGIDLNYTENVKDLNKDTLARYDALVIYANTEPIAPEQEKALLDYVEGGGGFVPLHCARIASSIRPVHRPGRRPVPEAWHRRVRHQGRRRQRTRS